MSKADKMFEELGYSILKDDKNEIVVHYIKSSNLSANESEHIVFHKTGMVGCYYTYCTFKKELSVKELQAINEKVKELRLVIMIGITIMFIIVIIAVVLGILSTMAIIKFIEWLV